MFGIRIKSENYKLYAPVDGKLISIEEISDPVFAERMLGDGFAIASTGDTIYAPADGKITTIFPSSHVIGITLDEQLEILIHIGVDTANADGLGFTRLCEEDQEVKQGDVLLTMDRRYLEESGYDLSVMIIFPEKDQYESFACEDVREVKGGKTLVAEVEV